MKACTIIARNYLPYARVLAESFAAHHPGKKLSVLVLDDFDRTLDASGEQFDLVRPADLDLSTREFHRMATIYSVLELATAVKPWLLQYLLDQGAEVAMYLDPDIEVFAPLNEAAQLALEHDIVLTPHTLAPMPRDGRYPNEADILISGTYNLGFISVSKAAESFLEWWKERLKYDCVVSVAEGYFVDQRWIDFLPGYFNHFILRDPSYNVAYWNLYNRRVTLNAENYEVNGLPLHFFHFSGFSPAVPFLLSKHQRERPRVLLSEHPAVLNLCNSYSEKLIRHGYEEWSKKSYGFEFAANGFKLNDQIRRVCRSYCITAIKDPEIAKLDLPNPFDPQQTEAFLEWLKKPAPWSPNRRISRYLQAIYDERYDLRLAFPRLWGPDADRYLDWAHYEHIHNNSIPWELLPEEPTPQSKAKSLSPSELKAGVNVAGYMNTESGLGEAGRLLVSVLEAGKVPFSVMPPFKFTRSRQEDVFTESGIGVPDFDISIISVNADQMPVFADHVGRDFLHDRYSIGFWAWEVEEFPEWMARSEEFVDEVWVYGRHAQAAVSAAISKPVYSCPLPVKIPQPAALSKTDFGLPENFMFTFCFDFASVFERKNPIAVIEAFKQAFSPEEGPILVIKSINGAKCLVDMEKLRAAAAGRPDIRIMDGYLSREEQQALMNVTDVYVSLHRSEGFGLTMAEAMALGKPVIATGYSGNLEFMDEQNSFLVPYKLVAIPPGCEPYPEGSKWADP
ncbi:MAG TPA: glycosyltransferase, partial [Terriglobales bacterium]|nr:glycosyltransferase [Terriglobales bacterium]